MSDPQRIDSNVARLALYSVAATRLREAAALAAQPPFTLMALAGLAAARLALALAPHARRVLVFAGPGNNGGDGLEAAARLAGFGCAVDVVLLGDAARLPADAAQARARATAAGVSVAAAIDEGALDVDGTPDLVIDALLGIGISRPPSGTLERAIDVIATLKKRGARVLAIDVPSGLDADRGQAIGAACVAADDTLTLIGLKPGLFTAAGRDAAGTVWLDTLGASDNASAVTDATADAWLVGRRDASCIVAPRRQAQHKGSFGDVAIVGGSTGMTGAALLAARSAQAAGPGRVFVDLLDAQAGIGVDPLHPELMFRRDWWQGANGVLAATTVVCGCGGGDAVRAALPRLLSLVPRLVLDADALNAIAVDPSLQALLAGREGRGLATILTPHPLEAARLLGVDAKAVQADRLGAATRLAERHCAVVVVKGSGTVIATHGQAPRINATGNASLASAGTGDVLAGWIGGRWAEGSGDAFDTATRGVVEHGAAAEPALRGAMRAGDVIEGLHRNSRGD